MVLLFREAAYRSGQLVSATAGVLIRLWPALVSLMLIGWVGYHGSVLLAVTLAAWQAYLMVPALALGVVCQLAAILIALRLVAADLGVPGLIESTDGIDPAEAPDGGLTAVLGMTLLPFLGVYAAFGLAERFVTDTARLIVVRYGWGAVLSELNPVGSTLAVGVTVGVLIGLLALRRLLEHLQERTGAAWYGLVGVVVEASGLFLVLLSGFRIVESVTLWWRSRQLRAWLEVPLEWLLDLVRIDLPLMLLEWGEFLAQAVWPLLWEVLAQPIAWLALSTLAFGSRMLSVADLLRSGTPGGAAGAPHPQAQDPQRPSRLRATLMELQGFLLGDLNDKYLPSWQALRLVLGAGVPFMAAFIGCFTVVELGGDALVGLIERGLGSLRLDAWIKWEPFLDLVPGVVVTAVKMALLGAAYSQMLTGFGETSSAPPVGVRQRLRSVALVALVCVVLAGAGQLVRSEGTETISAQVGAPASLLGSEVTVGAVRTGRSYQPQFGDPIETTDSVFVMVEVSLFNPGDGLGSAGVSAVAGERTYDSWEASISTAAGFRTTQWQVFEVLPQDLGDLELRLSDVAVLAVPLELPTGVGGDRLQYRVREVVAP